MSNKGRLIELDALRGIAAFAVVLFHYTYRYHGIYGAGEVALPFTLWWGDQGVQLFFMISGFVIFMTLERTQETKDFLVSRFSRLYPTYWAALFATFTSIWLFGLPGRESSALDFAVNLTMLQGFIPNIDHVDGVYWTLTIELSFYCLMLGLHVAKLLPKIELIAILWLICAVLFKFSNISDHRFGQILEVFFVLKYCNFFVAGISFYKIYTGESSKLTYFTIFACLFLSTVLNDHNNIYVISGSFLMFYLVVLGRATWLKIPPLVFLGGISYALYLVHQNIGYLVIRGILDLGMSMYTGVAAAIILSVLLATIITYLVEKPAIRLIRRTYKTYKNAKFSNSMPVSE